MRFLTPRDVVDLLSQNGFTAMSRPEVQRTPLVLDKEIASGQRRVGGRPPSVLSQLSDFVDGMVRWYPSPSPRVLWLDSWNWDFPSSYDLFVSARKGLGEIRSLFDVPGHYFNSYPYDERDQTKIPPDQAHETGLLIGFTSLLMINGWDGWLVAPGTSDRIEFWEGNFFFYSADTARLRAAESLMDAFGCPRDLV